MDIAIVTGAGSSLGLAISRRLIDLGFRVYGLGGDYKDCPLNNVNFKPMSLDLSDPRAIERACSSILEKEKGVCLLVNNAKFFGRRPFREMEGSEIEAILRINLLAPLVLVRQLQESLCALQGMIIQIGSAAAQTSYGGAAGAAASGGLKWMGEALFHDLRDAGVRVCHLSPEPNRGRDASSGGPDFGRKESTIDPEAVAQAIEQLIQTPYGNIVTEIVLRPLRTREKSEPTVVRLPTPPPQPIPYTVPRAILEAEDELDEQEWLEKNQERQRQRDERREKPKERKPAAEKQAAKPAAERSRPKAAPSKSEPQSERPAANPAEAPANVAPDESPATASEQQSAPSQSGGRSSRRRRKPRPPMAAVGFLDRVKPKEDAPAAAPATPSSGPATSNPANQSEKPQEKSAQNHARSSAPQASATKKAAARKSPRKRPTRKEPSASVASPKAGQVPPADKGEKPATKRAAKKAPRKRAAKKVAAKESGKDSA